MIDHFPLDLTNKEVIQKLLPGALVESVEGEPRVREVRSTVLGRVKPDNLENSYLELPGQVLGIIKISLGPIGKYAKMKLTCAHFKYLKS